MIRLSKELFDNSDYTKVPTNKAAFSEQPLAEVGVKNVDIAEVRAKNTQDENDKFVHFSVGNNESLPFKGDQFDAYVANLSLMLVDNHKNQLTEAFRVLKSGGTAAFSIWGRRENTNQFTLFPRSMKECGFKAEAPPKSPFDLGYNPNLK